MSQLVTAINLIILQVPHTHASNPGTTNHLHNYSTTEEITKAEDKLGADNASPISSPNMIQDDPLRRDTCISQTLTLLVIRLE